MAILNRVRTVLTGVAGTPWYTNHYFEDVSPLQTCIQAVADFWTAGALSMIQEVDWEVEAAVAKIDDSTGQIIDFASGTPVSGSGASSATPLPFANQGLIHWRTGVYVNGRELRGRTFWPGLTETDVQEGALTPAAQGRLEDAADALLSSGTEFVVYSPTHLTHATVAAASVPTLVAVQRSRRD